MHAEIIRRLRERTDALIMPTLGAWNQDKPTSRIDLIVELCKDPRTRPDITPIDLGSVNVDAFDAERKQWLTEDRVYVNSRYVLRRSFELLRELGTGLMCACWDVGQLRTLAAFVQMGLIREPVWAELVLTGDLGGLLSGPPGTVEDYEAFLAFLPRDLRAEWGVLNYGGSLLAIGPGAIARGHHLAIGIGDYHYNELKPHPTSADVIAHMVQVGRQLGREPATPDDARALLAVPPR